VHALLLKAATIEHGLHHLFIELFIEYPQAFAEHLDKTIHDLRP
jgi:hypothetical protein